MSNLLTVKEAATQVDRSISSVRSWIRSGKLKSHKEAGGKQNSRVLINRNDLLAYMSVEKKANNVTRPSKNNMLNDVMGNKLIDNLERENKRLESYNDKLLRENDLLKQELDEARQLSNDLKEKAWNLELQLNQTDNNKGVVKGLFGSVKRLLTA